MGMGHVLFYIIFLIVILSSGIGLGPAILFISFAVLLIAALASTSSKDSKKDDSGKKDNTVTPSKDSNTTLNIGDTEKKARPTKYTYPKDANVQLLERQKDKSETIVKKREDSDSMSMEATSSTLIKNDLSVRATQIETEQPENSLVRKAISLYEACKDSSGRTIDIEQVINQTQKNDICWYDGEDCKVEVLAAEYQDCILALYRNVGNKKYSLILYENKNAYNQKLTKVTELRKEIIHQIEKRKKIVEIVPPSSFLVRTNMFKCIKSHGIKDIIAVFKVLDARGNVNRVEAPAGKCDTCGIFYIHEYIFKKVLSYGQPLCQIISEKQYLSGTYLKISSGMAQKSLLKICGYSVSAAEGLSDTERQRILKSMVDNGIMSSHEIISYLQYFVTISKHQKKNMTSAIGKWEKDIRYVERLPRYGTLKYDVGTVYRIEK